MDETDKIDAQIDALTAAQAAIKKNYPDDVSSYRQLADMVSDLYTKRLALESDPDVPALTPQAETDLENAEKQLTASVEASQSVTQILVAATALAQL